MPLEIKMPALSPTMKSGILSKWNVKEGDKVESGDILAEVETDKAVMEVESLSEGEIGKIIIPAKNEDVKVGEVIALMLKKGETKKDLENYKIKSTVKPSEESKVPTVKEEPKKEAKEQQEETKQTNNKSVVSNTAEEANQYIHLNKKATPLANVISKKLNIDINSVYGTGIEGKVTKKDVENYSGSRNSGKGSSSNYGFGRITNYGEGTSVKISNMRKVIGKRLQESKLTIPHFYVSVECNMNDISKARDQINTKMLHLEEKNKKISFNDIIIKATGNAIRKHPNVNKFLDGDNIISNEVCDVCMAIALENGLVAPKIMDVDVKSITNIAEETKDIISRAKSNKISIDEMQGGSITVSNLGSYGIDEFIAIVNPPQSMIIAVGGIIEKPIFDKNKNIISGKMMKIYASADHRILDGADVALFLKEVKNYIENPYSLLLDI